jgi:hypothetical protein
MSSLTSDWMDVPDMGRLRVITCRCSKETVLWPGENGSRPGKCSWCAATLPEWRDPQTQRREPRPEWREPQPQWRQSESDWRTPQESREPQLQS